MSVNRYKKHVYVIPEDDADRQIANGFAQHDGVDTRRIQIMPPAGGWMKVLDTFVAEYVPRLRQNDKTHIVLLIDFDGNHKQRLGEFQQRIPDECRDRVFVIGPQTTPEALRQEVNQRYEQIGSSLAEDCAADTTTVWSHAQLQHNEDERVRLVATVKPFLIR